MPDLASLEAWRKPRRLAVAKTLALVVSLCFVWPYVAFAFEPATYPRDLIEEFRYVPLTANGQTLDIKPEWGRVTSSYRGTSGKTVVFIQDLHCNYEVQSNIQAMLSDLAKRNRLRVVGVEGESAPVNVDKLSTIPLAPVKERVGQYFLQRGRITGAEYQAATGDDPLFLQGIESQALYDHNQNTLLKFLNEESQGYCQDLRFALEQLKRPVYNTDLAKMDHERENFEQENQTLEKYCDFLLAEAGRLGVELEPYKVIRLYALEHRLPVNAVVDYERLLHEAEALDRAIRKRLYTSDEQRRLDQQLYVLKITENLINISATEEDLRYFRGHREEFRLEPMLRFLEEVSYRYALQPDLDPGVLKLADYLDLAAEFYRVADQRSHAFVENLLRAMGKRREDLAVLITGGFHATHVEQALRDQGISFLTIKPRLTRTDVANPYFSLLRNERTPLEKLLARNENIFAPRSLFNNPMFRRYLETVWEIELGRKLVLEDKLSGDALQQAFRAARGQYAADDAKVNLAFRPEQSNPDNNIYVFQFEQEASWYVVVRPNATTAYTTELAGEVLQGNNFQFQFVAAEEFAAKRAQILGVEEPGRAGVFAVGGLAARLAEVTNPVTRALGTLAIALGAPEGLRGLTPATVVRAVFAPAGRLLRPAANLWSSVAARVSGFFQPEQRLIERAMLWSMEKYGYAQNQLNRTELATDLQTIMDLTRDDEALRTFISGRPERLALAGMAFRNGRLPILGEITPTANLNRLVRDFNEAEELAVAVLAGTPVAQLDLKNAGSNLAQLVQAIRDQRQSFLLGEQDVLNQERLLPEYTTTRQLDAMRQLARRHNIRVQIPNFSFNPVVAFRPVKLQVTEARKGLTGLVQQLDARVLEPEMAMAAAGQEVMASAEVEAPAETAPEAEIAEAPRINLQTPRRPGPDTALLGPAGAGAETRTLEQIMDRATPLRQVLNGAQRQTVMDGLRLLGFQVRADGQVVLPASHLIARVQAARRALDQEQRTVNRRLNFLNRLNAPTPAQLQERFELQQRLQRYPDAVFELDEMLATFRTSGDRVFEVRLSDEMDTLAHGQAFSEVRGSRVVLNAKALNQMNSSRNRVQLMRRLAHESGHIAGLEQTRIGEIRAGLIAKILAGTQLGIADFAAEIGNVNRRAILGETAELPLAAVGPASEITLTAGQREAMGSWFDAQGWTQVALDRFAALRGALTSNQLDSLVPGAAEDPTHQAGVKLLAQLSQALAAADSGVYSASDLLETFKLTLQGLTLEAAVAKHLADQGAYAREAVPAEFAAYEAARAPIRTLEDVRRLMSLAFGGEEGLAFTPALRLLAERIAAEEAAKFTDADYTVEFYLNFEARAAEAVKGLPAALQPQTRQALQAAAERALASQPGAMTRLIERKLQTQLPTPEAAVTALSDFSRFFRSNFQEAIFSNQADMVRNSLRRWGQDLLRQTASQQVISLFGNKAPPTRETLNRLLPADYPVEFLLSKLAIDQQIQQSYPLYTSQFIWYLGAATKSLGYVPALNQLQQAVASADSRREVIRGRLQQALDQMAWFFDETTWPELEQIVLSAYRAQYVQGLAGRLGVSPSQVSADRTLASEAALAAELNVLAEELAALRQSQGGLTASLKRLATTAYEQATAALPQAQAPALALVGPKGAGITREEGVKSVRQTFNAAITEFRSGRYRDDRLLQLINEAETLLAALVQRYSQDADVRALQANFAEQKQLLIQGMQLNTFTARNPGFRQSLERLADEVSESTAPIAWSAFLTYAVSGAQIVSRGGVPHATYSNPNAENIQQAQYAGYMRLAVINGQTVLCVDNGSSHFNRPGFRGADKQFMAAIRGLKPALQALGIGKVVFFSGHALEGMTTFDQSKILGIVDVTSGSAQASKDLAPAVEIESYEAVAARAADLQPEAVAEQLEYIRARTGAVAEALRPFLGETAVASLAAALRNLTPETLRVRTAERIAGALAVNRDLGGQIQVIVEEQVEGDLRNSTVLHEAVEASLRAQGIAEAHALAFIVEQELAPESLRAKLSQPDHYDMEHLRNVVANTEAVIAAIDRQPGGTPALKQRQKDNALLAARVARSILHERQRVQSLKLDQRGFFGEETQAALTSLFTSFLKTQQELRRSLLRQVPGANTFRMAQIVVQRGFDLLDQDQLNAFFAFFGHKAEVRASLYTRQVLSTEIGRLRRSLQGTVYESTLNQALTAVQSLEAGQPLTVKVNGEDQPIVDLQIRKITANAAISPEALKVGAFFTVEETPAGRVGFINVMAHRQLPQAALHELLETVLGIDHRTVADLEAVSEYSLGKLPFFQSLAREIFWPTRVLSTVVGVIGLVAIVFAVGMMIFGAGPAAVIPTVAAGVVPLVWSTATYFKPRFIITVDGPDATGKTEIGDVLSRYYGYTYADAAMYYRAFALIVKDEIDQGNWAEDAFRAETPAEQRAFATFTQVVVDRLKQADVTMFFDRGLREQRMRVFLREGMMGGQRREITDQVLPTAASAMGEDFQRLEALASRLGQIPAVQRVVDEHLRDLAKRENLVAVGQTMGTKLFDRDAKMRFYVVNNDLRNRAERLLRRPLRTEAELAAGLTEIENMDLSARTRQRDPLRPIPEAVVLDTGNFTLADVLGTARQSIARRSEVVRNALARLWTITRERGRMLNRIQGESARRQVLEQVGDVWLGFSDIDGLSGYNLIYGKAITNYLLQDVLGIIEETANSRPVRQIVERNRRQFRRALVRAFLTLDFRAVGQLLPRLAETRITTIKHGGDEGLYLLPEYFSPREVGDVMKLFRSRVQIFMHRQFKPYEVLGLKPAEEQQLRAIAAKINGDYGDPTLVRVAYDEVYGVRLLLHVGRPDLVKRYQQELRGFAPITAEQANGNLIELIVKKRLEQAGLQAAQLENLNLTQMAWPRTTEDFKPPIDQKGYGYLQEGFLLTPTLSIGATKASRVDYAYMEKRASGTLTRSDVQAWSEALYQLAGDFLHQAKDAGKNQVVVDQLGEPIKREEKPAEAPVLGPTHGRQLQRQQMLFEDNLILRTGERPKHDAIYPKHFSTDGFRELVRQRLAVLAGRNDFQPEVHVSRAPPDSGPDKVHIAVITPETTYLLELEGQYFGPFVAQAREILKQRLAKEWSEEQQRPVEEVLADPALARALEETMASFVTATRDGTTYYRFKLLNDALGYTAGDQTIGLPHMILDRSGLSLLRQPGRMLRKLPAVLNELEQEMNDPQKENQVRIALTAVFSEMPTKQAVQQGVGRLFSDLQVASMAKQGRITTYHPTLRKPALVKQMEAAVTRLRELLAQPDAQARMVEEVESVVDLQRWKNRMQGGFARLEFLAVMAGAALVAMGVAAAVAAGTVTLATTATVSGGLALLAGMTGWLRFRASQRNLAPAVQPVTQPGRLAQLLRRAADFIRGNPMIILLVGAGLYALLNQQPAEGGVALAAMGMVTASGGKGQRIEDRVAAMVKANPELEPVAPQLIQALFKQNDFLKIANKFEGLHRALRTLENYDPAVIVQVMLDRPQNFVHFEPVLTGFHRKFGFATFTQAQDFIAQMDRMARRTGLNAGRLLNMLTSNRLLTALNERGIEMVADLVEELGLEALSRLQQQMKESEQEQYYLAYESLQVARYLERIIDAATAPVLICENVAYGMFVTQPLRQRVLDYAAQKGKKVEFIKSRARSGMSHTNPPYIADQLFYPADVDISKNPEADITAEIMQRLMTEAPHVVVLDGSKNQRYPDGFQQFSNLAVLLNHALNPSLPVQDVLELSKKSDPSHAAEALRDKNNRPLLTQLRQLRSQAARAVYDVQYWTPDGRLLPTRRNKLFDRLQRNYETFQERPGQRELILINATVNNASVPQWLTQFMAEDAPEMRGKTHRPGYFEDFYDFANGKFYARLQELFNKLSARQPESRAAAVPALDAIRPDLGLNPAQVFNIFHDALAAVLLTQKGAPLTVDERDGRQELPDSSKLAALVPELERQMAQDRMGQTYKGILTDWTGTVEEKDVAQALREGKQVGLVTSMIMNGPFMARTVQRLRDEGVTEQDLARFRVYGENGATKWQWQDGQPVSDQAYQRALTPEDVAVLEQLLADYPARKGPEARAGYYFVSCRSREKAFELARFIARQFPRLQRQYALYVEGRDLRIFPWEVTKRRAAEDMAADLGIEPAELFLAGDSAASVFDTDLALVADSGFNLGPVRSPMWGVSARRTLDQPLTGVAATRALLAKVKILRADEFQAQPRAPAAQAASPLDGTPGEIQDYLARTFTWNGSNAAFMSDLMQALYSLGSSWRSPRMLRLTRAMAIAWLLDRYSDAAPDVTEVVDTFGLSEAERSFVRRSAEENVLTTLGGEYVKDRPIETSIAYFWNQLLQTRERRDAQAAAQPRGEAEPAPAPAARGLSEQGSATLPVMLGLGGAASLAAGITLLVTSGALTLLSGGAVLLGAVLLAAAGWALGVPGLERMRITARRELSRDALARHLRRAVDFIRGNPMIVIAVIGYGLLAWLQQPEGANLMMGAGAIGMIGLSRDTLIEDVYKIPQRTSGDRRLSKIYKHLNQAGVAAAEIDSFADLQQIYGADIAAFIHEKTLQIIQHYLGRQGLLFRYEDREGNFAFMQENAGEERLAELFRNIQTFLFNSFNRRFRVVTLPNLGLDDQGQPLPERDLGVRLTQLSTLVRQYGHGAVGITTGNRVHITYEISAQANLQHALEVAGLLDPERPEEKLAAMPFENEALVGLRQGFLYVPKLNVGIAGNTVYQLALAELPGKAEYRTELPGHQISSRMLNSAVYAAKNQARVIGGGIVVAREFSPLLDEAPAETVAETGLAPEMVLFNFNLRNDQIFQRWFLDTANDIVENSQDKLAAFDALRQLYDSNQDIMQEEEFDYLGHIFMQARRLIEEMRQAGHYALPEAERKFADITMLWESRYGDQAMRHFFRQHPELQPALGALENAYKPRARERDLAQLRELLRGFIEEKDLEVMATPGRVKQPFSLLMNFLRYWNRVIKAKPDFTDLSFYQERNVRIISDDVVGMLLVIPDLTQMQRAVNELIPYLESKGFRIKPEDGHKIKGVNIQISADAQGQYRIQPKQEGYYDVKLKIAPSPQMPFGAEIKILPDFIEESATRPGYTLIKQAVLKEVSWTVAIGGPSGTGKLEAARLLAQRLNYAVVDVGLLYRGIYAAAKSILDAGQADDLETVLRRGQIVLFDDSVKVVYGRKGQAKTEVVVNREQAMAVEPSLTPDQSRFLNRVVERIVQAQAKRGRVVVVGQDPFAYLPNADIKIYFDLSTEERAAIKTKTWEQLPAPKDALNISSEIQRNPDMTVRLVEQMIADAILTRGLSASPSVRRSTKGNYQALSLRNTLVVAAVWVGILSLGLGLPVLPALGMGLLYPAAKIVTATRLLAAKYGFPGMLRHLGEPVGAYDPAIQKMVDPQTGAVLGEADWPVAWHEGFSHAAVQRALRFLKIDLAALQPGTLRHTVVAGLAEFATHTLDTLTAPLALARLRTGPRWEAVALSGVFLASGLLLAASFFVALPAAAPLALAAVFAVTGLSVAWMRGALAPSTATPGAVAEMDLAAGDVVLAEVLDQVRSDQRLGVAAQPAAGVWQRIRESRVGRALNQLRGLPAGLKLLMLLPKPQTNAWAKAAVIGVSLAVWAGVSIALVNSAGVSLATGMVLLGLSVWAPGHAFNYRLRTTAATPLARAIADSEWMEQAIAALNRPQNSAQVSLLLQELLGALNQAKDDPQAREAVLEVLASLTAYDQRTATLQLADGSQSTHKLPAILFEKPNLLLRLRRVFPVITIDNQPLELPQPRQRRAVDNAA